jgi:DNA-binding response OmpR family regulator
MQPPTKGRILCTEDDPDSRELIVWVLTDYGFDVSCSETSDHAIELAKAEHFDLYLLDSWMPGLSGTDLTKKLREFDLTTPVLFYSAAAFDSDKQVARLAGAKGYLVKPETNDILIAEIIRLIAESKIAIPVESTAPTSACSSNTMHSACKVG